MGAVLPNFDALELVGSATPRLWTRPLRKLTPRTSLGFEVVDFSRDVLGIPLLPWQEWLFIHGLELRPDGNYRFRTVLVLVARQNGKALDCETPMLTTSGWKTMGTLAPGDKVFHPGGHPVAVTGAFDVMHDRTCYRVTTTDGRSIVADADHLWTVMDKRRPRSLGPAQGPRRRWFETVTLTTAEMVATGVSRHAAGHRETSWGGQRYVVNEYRYVLPTQEPLKTPDVELPVDPYLLGMWLGDGTSRASHLSVGDADLDHVLAEIERAGARVVSQRRDHRAWRVAFRIGQSRARDGFGYQARQLGIWGAKHIPDVYLTAGTSQREALLQGLMDTDGCISSGQSQVEFCSMSRSLADGVLFLARSLGWRATLCKGRATIGGRDCGAKYRVYWSVDQTDSFAPFRMARKIARVHRSVKMNGARSTVAIKSIEPVESVPVRCIKVDSPDGLFLAGRDLVATHNTTALMVLALWRMVMDSARMVLGTSTNLDYARESWQKATELAWGPKGSKVFQGVPELEGEFLQPRYANGEQELTHTDGGRYKIGTASRTGGRSLSVDLLILDELREHRTWEAWSAASKTTNAQSRGQRWALSNMGDDGSVVLNHLQTKALEDSDPSLGIFEWSAPPGCDPADRSVWPLANPALGHRISVDTLASDLSTDAEEVFRTEVLCQRVPTLEPLPITLPAWVAAEKRLPERPAGIPTFGLSVSPMLSSAAITAAVRIGETFHLELVDWRDDVDWLPERAAELKARYPGCQFVAMTTGAVASLTPDLKRLEVEPETLGATDLGKAYGSLHGQLVDGQLTQDGARGFELALQGAVKRDVGEGLWSLSWRKSSADLAPIESAAIAVWQLAGRPSYDLLDSVM